MMMSDTNALIEIAQVIDEAGDMFPRNESRSFWRDLMESVGQFIEDRDATTFRNEYTELVDRYTVPEAGDMNTSDGLGA